MPAQVERAAAAGAKMVNLSGVSFPNRIGWHCQRGVFRFATAAEDALVKRLRAIRDAEADSRFSGTRKPAGTASSSGANIQMETDEPASGSGLQRGDI